MQSATKRLVEAQQKRPLEALLRGYHEVGWTQSRIADELGVSRQTVIRWFQEFGIETKRGPKRAA